MPSPLARFFALDGLLASISFGYSDCLRLSAMESVAATPVPAGALARMESDRPAVVRQGSVGLTERKKGRLRSFDGAPRGVLVRRLHRAARRADIMARQRRQWLPFVASIPASLILFCFDLPLVALITIVLGSGFYALRVAAVALSPAYMRRVHSAPGPPIEPEVLPHEIDPLELRTSYEEILRTHERVRTLLCDSERIRDNLQGLYVSCGELVEMAGRVARLGNSLERYLNGCRPEELLLGAERLEARAAQARDPEARRTYLAAAMARRHQLSTYTQLQGLYDRIRARLEVVIASLENVQAMVVKLRALDLEQVAISGDGVAMQIDVLRQDLDIVESAMAEALAS
jgi:hypothetical protein